MIRIWYQQQKVKPKRNNIKDVIAYIISNLYFASIHENTPLFLACEFYSRQQVVLGDESPIVSLRILLL